MITVDPVLDSQRAAYLDCEHGAMTHADGEVHLIERLKAGDPDALETYRKTVELTGRAGHVEMAAEMKSRLRRLLLDQLWSGGQ